MCPRYDWVCDSCKKEADIICKVDEIETIPPELENCCSEPKRHRVIKTANFRLNGYGWAKDGYS